MSDLMTVAGTVWNGLQCLQQEHVEIQRKKIEAAIETNNNNNSRLAAIC